MHARYTFDAMLMPPVLRMPSLMADDEPPRQPISNIEERSNNTIARITYSMASPAR